MRSETKSRWFHASEPKKATLLPMPSSSATLQLRRCAVAAVYEVVINSAAVGPSQGWRAGPLALSMSPEERTDARWRAQFVHRRVASALYANDRRMHREFTDGAAIVPRTTMRAVAGELLHLRAGSPRRANALLVAHFSPVTQGQQLLNELKIATRDLDSPAASDVHAWIVGLLPAGGSLGEHQRSAPLLVFATHEPGSPMQRDSEWRAGVAGTWDLIDEWRWALAMASPRSARRLAHPEEPEPAGVLIRMPRRDAQVVDRGISMLGTRQDSAGHEGPEYAKDVIRSRTLFVDALLLGAGQRVLLSQIADDIAACGDVAHRQRSFRAVQRDMRIFRNRYWWREFSTWRWPDEVLQAFQDVNRLPTRVEALVDELSDYAAELEIVNSQRTNLGLALVALLGIPGAVGSALVATGTDTGTATTWLTVIAALIIIPVLLVMIAFIRGSLPRGSDEDRLYS